MLGPLASQTTLLFWKAELREHISAEREGRAELEVPWLAEVVVAFVSLDKGNNREACI